MKKLCPTTTLFYIAITILAIALSSCKQTYTVAASSYPKPLIKLKQFYADRGYKYKKSKYINDSTVIITFKK